jgi:hypothetical protein
MPIVATVLPLGLVIVEEPDIVSERLMETLNPAGIGNGKEFVIEDE